MLPLRSKIILALSGSRPWVDVETALISKIHPVVALGVQRDTHLIVALAVHDRPDFAAFGVAESVLIGAGSHARHVTIARDHGVSGQPWNELILNYGARLILGPPHFRNTGMIATLAEALGELPRRLDEESIYQCCSDWAHKTNKQTLANKNEKARRPQIKASLQIWR